MVRKRERERSDDEHVWRGSVRPRPTARSRRTIPHSTSRSRAPRETNRTSLEPLLYREDQTFENFDSRRRVALSSADRAVRSRPTARSRRTIPHRTSRSRARRETYDKSRLASARWDSKDRTEGRLASLTDGAIDKDPPNARTGPLRHAGATQISHSHAGGDQNHPDSDQGRTGHGQSLDYFPLPRARESLGAREREPTCGLVRGANEVSGARFRAAGG